MKESANCSIDPSLLEIAQGAFQRHTGLRGLDLPFPEITLQDGFEEDEYELTDQGLLIGSENVLMNALGEYLRSGGTKRGRIKPAKFFRCVYLAQHFFNTYQKAPLQFLYEYMEDLALWGFNVMQTGHSTPIRYLTGPAEPTAAVLHGRKIEEYAHKIGFKFFGGGLANGGFIDTPLEFRAADSGRGRDGREICPNIPGGLELIKRIHRARAAEKQYLDYLNIWPYDEGGCGCEKCYPWGSNGMLLCGREMMKIYKEKFPDLKVVYTTWCFNYKGEHEIEDIYEKLHAGEEPWIDMIMSDTHHADFNQWQLENPLPERVKMINFPEISMWGRSPWGGFGATPQPRRFARLWGQVCNVSSGGTLYSEGIHEDFNKVLYAHFYRTGTNDWQQAARDYAAYEFGCTEPEKFIRLLEMLEDNHAGLIWSTNEYHWQKDINIPEEWGRLKRKPHIWTDLKKKWYDAAGALALAQEIDAALPDWGRRSWRWEFFMIRAKIDAILERNNNEPDDDVEELLKRLVEIEYLDEKQSYRAVYPRTDTWLELPEFDYLRGELPAEVSKDDLRWN